MKQGHPGEALEKYDKALNYAPPCMKWLACAGALGDALGHCLEFKIGALRGPRRSLCYFHGMDKRITRYSSLRAMKADEYRSWQRLPGSERIRAVMDLTLELYAMKGQAADAPRLQRTVICIQRRAG
jgi:hypothetical protein